MLPRRRKRWTGTRVRFALLLLAAGGCMRRDPQRELRATVDEAIAMLDRGDHAQFLERFVAPDERERVLGGAPLEVRARQFGQQAGARMLRRLRAVRPADCRLDEQKHEYDCLVGAMEPDLVFAKIAGRWYLRN